MKTETKSNRYTFYNMEEAWYVYDRENSVLADGWGGGGEVRWSKVAVMRVINKMNKEESKKADTKMYKVFKVGRKSGRRQILERNLTESEAQRVVARYPNSTRSMVCYTAQ